MWMKKALSKSFRQLVSTTAANTRYQIFINNYMELITKVHIAIMTNEDLVKNELIPTWQPLAAIAFRTGLPIRTCEAILVKMYNAGEVKCSRVRIDGHNKVHLFKKIQYQKIMGVMMPLDTSGMEA